ncbi:DUF3592 domain-containing protein [Alteromonas halophila]|uniref:DUF3592 domain-containing protein n=1 Tax=Alteromonas halophila TaxID=516698 RepID=A0A918JR01_9ALTE|nr:DUF3592 domain-containing protein [Alteromonas halophila]GGW96880.1 hypothetical protein GCM10007391_33700 [Alteromonas halophila]
MTNTAFWGGIFLLLVALYLLKGAIRSLQQFDQSAHWPTAKGRILNSEVVRYKATSSRHDFLVSYVYEVKGKEYKSNRAALYTIIHQRDAEALLARFKEGTDVDVFYNPEAPSEAVLVTGHGTSKKYSEVILAGVVLVVAVVITISGFYGWIGS